MTKISLLTIANRLNAKVKTQHLPPLIYMTDHIRMPNPLITINNLPSGSGVILRHYNNTERKNLGLKIKKICINNKLKFFVAGDYNLAYELDADGLHLPEHQTRNPAILIRRWQQRPDRILTIAAHSSKTLQRCKTLNVNAALLSPVFKTDSHPDNPSTSTLGTQRITTICKNTDVPVYALGGINNNNAKQLLHSGVIGIAGISGIANL